MAFLDLLSYYNILEYFDLIYNYNHFIFLAKVSKHLENQIIGYRKPKNKREVHKNIYELPKNSIILEYG